MSGFFLQKGRALTIAFHQDKAIKCFMLQGEGKVYANDRKVKDSQKHHSRFLSQSTFLNLLQNILN